MKKIIEVDGIDEILWTDKVILKCGNLFSGAFEQVVRCEECVHATKVKALMSTVVHCDKWKQCVPGLEVSDYYCSFGRRKKC